MSRMVCRCGFSEREEKFPGYTLEEGGRLFRCPNCEYFILWDRTSHLELVPVDGAPRVRVPSDAGVDQLGRPLLTAEETLRDIRDQRLILGPALDVIALIDGAEVRGTVEGAVDAAGEISSDWVFHAGGRRV